MNVFQLVLKQMRQRALGTWLTLLSVLLGVALACAIFLIRRESEKIFAQTEYGYELLIGAKSSPLQLALNTIYHIDQSPGNIPYSVYEPLVTEQQYRRMVKIAIPMAVGDTYHGKPIIATTTQFFGFDDSGKELERDKVIPYRPARDDDPAKFYEMAEGRCFHPQKFEAVIGASVADKLGMKIGQAFKAAHGAAIEGQEAEEHDENWKIVGILKPTGTSTDDCLFIPLITFYTIEKHEEALEAQAKVKAGEDVMKVASATHDHEHEEHYTVREDGTIDLKVPKEEWQVSAVMVKVRSPNLAQSLQYAINNRNDAMALVPAVVMREFFQRFLGPSAKILLLISYLVTVVAGVGILVSIYNSVSARMKEIAILRALGATRRKVLALICIEAGLIGLFGGLAGLVAGHLLGAAGSVYMNRLIGQRINWVAVGRDEWIYLGVVVLIAVLAGLVPAMKAYRTPVATNLVAS